MLERLGQMAARRHWAVIAVWLVIAATVVGLAARFGGKTNDDFAIPGTGSEAAQELLGQSAPGFGNANVNVVFTTTTGSVNDQPKQAAIKAALGSLRAVPNVANVSDPFQTVPLPAGYTDQTVLPVINQPISKVLPSAISPDGTTAVSTVQMNQSTGTLPSPQSFEQLQAAAQTASSGGVVVELGGALVDLQNPPPPGISEYADEIGLLCAVVILLIALGSMTAMLVPIGVALFSLGISGALLSLAEAHWAIGSAAPPLGVMIGLGVGIDYSLFIVNRYRQNLGQGMDVERAAGRALTTSGSAVLFAAITVCLALCGLALIGIPYVGTLGFAAAMFVAVTVCAALTVLPALLGLLGRRIDSLKLPWHRSAEQETPEVLSTSFSARWAREIAKHPLLFTIASLALLLLIAFPITRIELGIPDDGSLPNELTQTKAFDTLDKKFGPGRNGPLLLVADLGPEWQSTNTKCNAPGGAAAGAGAGTTVGGSTSSTRSGAITATSSTSPATTPPPTSTATTPTGTAPAPAPRVQAIEADLIEKFAPALFNTPGVQSVTPVLACTGQLAVAIVVPKTGPGDPATTTLVQTLRNSTIPSSLTGTAVNPSAVHVGGQTAILIDLTDTISKRMPYFVGAVLALSFVLLMMVFRSIFVPMKAVLMNLLSIGASLGFLVAVFQWGWLNSAFGIDETIAIVAFIPVMMFAVLFGLSMDYEVFLLSRIHEEWLKTGRHRDAVVNGLGATARVITAAALIMISVFLTFSFNPSVIVKMLALGMAAAVLIDATIVRMIAVPATMELAGKWAWWIPRWLDRILPRIKVDMPEPSDPQPEHAA